LPLPPCSLPQSSLGHGAWQPPEVEEMDLLGLESVPSVFPETRPRMFRGHKVPMQGRETEGCPEAPRPQWLKPMGVCTASLAQSERTLLPGRLQDRAAPAPPLEPEHAVAAMAGACVSAVELVGDFHFMHVWL